MTAPIAAFRAPAAGTAAPRGRADPHLVAYLGVGCAALVGAVVIGRAELAAIAAPLVALGLWGVVDTSPPAPRAAAELLAARALEGDEVHGTVTVDWDGTAEIDVLVEGLPGVTAVEPAPTLGWSLPALAGPVTSGSASGPTRGAGTSWAASMCGPAVRGASSCGNTWWPVGPRCGCCRGRCASTR